MQNSVDVNPVVTFFALLVGARIAGLLGICTSYDDFWRGLQLHCVTIKLNLDSSAFIGNVIITMYSKFNLIEEAEKVFGMG